MALMMLFGLVSCRSLYIKSLVKNQIDQFYMNTEELFAARIESDQALLASQKEHFEEEIIFLSAWFPLISEAYSQSGYEYRFVKDHHATPLLAPLMTRVKGLYNDGVDLKPLKVAKWEQEEKDIEDLNNKIKAESGVTWSEEDKVKLLEDIVTVSKEKGEALTSQEIFDYCLLPENKEKYPNLHKKWETVHDLAQKRATAETNFEVESGRQFFIILDELLVDQSRYLKAWQDFSADPGAVIASIEPQVTHYQDLVKGLKAYRQYAKTPYDNYNFKAGSSTKIKEGKKGDLVVQIKKRLALEGYWTGEFTEEWGPELTVALTHYQENHQVVPDGVYGMGTAESFNFSMEDRINQIRLSLARLRHSKGRWEDYYVRINIPQMGLELRENQKIIKAHKVIVGNKIPKNHTPQFSDEIELINLNPSWFVPQRIIKEEMQGGFDNDPEFFKKKGYNAKVNEEGKVLSVTQPPGGGNALGNVKILFPNIHDVYLHDTATKHLFKRTVRPFSHGCMRLQDALDFAKLLLEKDNNPELADVPKYMEKRWSKEIYLQKKVPIHIEYVLASSNENGEVTFFGDVYNEEKETLMAMKNQ